MSTFQNTEQSYSTSGVSNTWLAANVSWQLSRNSGGLVNVAGPIIVKAIYLTEKSGFTAAGDSGNIYVAAHAVSGATSGGGATTGDVLFYYYGSQSGTKVTPAPITNLDFIAKSGLSTFVGNSGFTNAYMLNVVYGSPQI